MFIKKCKSVLVLVALSVVFIPQVGLTIEPKKEKIYTKSTQPNREFFLSAAKTRKKIYKLDTSVWLKKNLENRSFRDDLSKELPDSLNSALEIVSNPDHSMANGYHFDPTFNEKLQKVGSSRLPGFNLITAGFSKLPSSLSAEEKQNITNAISKIDGKRIEPGETFSFNKNMGKFNAENGFAEGRVLVNGLVESQFGGGACQVSSALYRALVNAGLSVTERQGHSRELSEYQPAGLDAMIYKGSQDLKFVNDFSNDVYIEAVFHNGNVVILLHGRAEKEVSLWAQKSEIKIKEGQKSKLFHWKQQIKSAEGARTYSILSRYKIDAPAKEDLLAQN